LWPIHRDEALKLYIEKYQGQRPLTWWRLDAPEPRPEIIWRDSSDNYATDRALARAEEISLLFRHSLLTPEEKALPR